MGPIGAHGKPQQAPDFTHGLVAPAIRRSVHAEDEMPVDTV